MKERQWMAWNWEKREGASLSEVWAGGSHWRPEAEGEVSKSICSTRSPWAAERGEGKETVRAWPRGEGVISKGSCAPPKTARLTARSRTSRAMREAPEGFTTRKVRATEPTKVWLWNCVVTSMW